MKITEYEKTDFSKTHNLMFVAARTAAEKKGIDTVILKMGDLLGITDAFVITSAANNRQVRTIADAVESQVKLAGGLSPRSTEGLDDARWVVLDYGDFVVHIFLEEARQYYDLERLWSDAPQLDWDDTKINNLGSFDQAIDTRGAS